MNDHNLAIDAVLRSVAIRSTQFCQAWPPQHHLAPAVFDAKEQCNSCGVIFARYELGPGDLLGWYFNHGRQDGSRTLIKNTEHALQLLAECGIETSDQKPRTSDQ